MTVSEAVIIRISSLCEQNRLSLYELSVRADISRATLQSIMNRTSSSPRIESVKKIADGLGITIRDFFNDSVFDRLL